MSQLIAIEKRPFMTYGLPLTIGVCVLVGGIISLLGWVLHIHGLTDWNNEGISIKANTSVCIIAAAAALIAAVVMPQKKWFIRVLGGLAGIIAALTLFQHFAHIDLGIDTLLFNEPVGQKATSAPGRMGIPASSAITMLGLGLVFTTLGTRSRKWASILATAALAISALSLTGYLFGANQLYAIPRYTGIALQTGAMVAALGFGIAAVTPEYGFLSVLSRADAGGVLLRRLTLPLIIISLSLGWFRVLGQDIGLYDTAFGTAVRTLLEIVLLLGLLWWTAKDISRSEREAHKAAGEIADRDDRMHGVLETLSDAFVSVDNKMRITYANASLMGLLKEYGGDVSAIIGRKAFDVLPTAKDTTLGEAMLKSLNERVPVDLEDYFAPFEGWFHARCLPTNDGGIAVFALNISEQKRSEQLIRRRANELGVLYSFSDRLNLSLNLDEVYEAALDTIIKGLGCDRASILLFDDKGVMSFVASRGLSETYQKAVTGHSPWKQGEKGARPMGISDVSNADLEGDLRNTILGEGIGSLGFIPLITNDVLIGKFMVYFDKPHEFADEEFEIALTVGYQIAVGVERKRTEQALRENEERLRLATQTGKVGVWDWDIRENRVSWTDSVYAMHGVGPDDFDGSVEAFSALIHPEDRSFVNSRIQMALAGEAPYEVEFRVPKRDGGMNWLFTNALVLRDANGPYRMTGATIDVTERKLTEQELAKAAAIVDSSLDAIVSKDLNGIITSWNRGAEKIFGYASDEVIGKPITILIPEERLDEEAGILERVHRGEPTNHYETVRCRKDGTRLDVSLTISPVRDANGRIIGASKIARDITEARRIQEALRDRETMRRLVEAQEAERHRIARDLHDHLGQQLTALRLKLETIRSLGHGNTELLTEIDRLQKDASRIDLDINYLAWELRPTELDHLGLVDSLSSFVREWSKTYGIDAEFHAARSNNGRFNPELETNLYRIVQEGLNNILKHAKASTVNVLLEHRSDDLILIIEDDGTGFESIEGRQNGSGKGLGLVGMRERTALLGGTLEIESRPGEGTTVFARVPLRPSSRNGDVT